MVKIRIGGEQIRRFIVDHVDRHPNNVAKLAAEKFGITRQAVNKHLQKLVNEGALTRAGKTRSRSYKLCPLDSWSKSYDIMPSLSEDQVWREDIAPALGKMPENVADIWNFGFTEMLNNAIDHSEGTKINVHFEKTAASTQIVLEDDGVGIFKKIQKASGLQDERHAVLELAKGKFTTDPANHTGEGIFFTSRMFDDFEILSGDIYFSHQFDKREDWIREREETWSGTVVAMKLNNHTARTTRKVFDKFTSGDDYGFTKTVVPVDLARYGDENLVSRSQAKRLLTRIERFRTVILDFRGIDSIGQAFADEVFRVFPAKHPDVEVLEMHASSNVKRMIARARSHEKHKG